MIFKDTAINFWQKNHHIKNETGIAYLVWTGYELTTVINDQGVDICQLFKCHEVIQLYFTLN